jgi:trans-aconitate methyltransferase
MSDNMVELAQRILSLRGIHYLATRLGGRRVRNLSFDGKFIRGDWDFDRESPDLVELVEQYCSNGHLLVLGCGTAAIAGALNPAAFQSLLGVDISQEAIVRANKHANDKIRFAIGDMLDYRCSRRYDVILFSNSLNYISCRSAKRVLRRLCASLTPQGKIIVSIAQPVRYASVIRMIRCHFTVEVDRVLQWGEGHVLVFC